MISTAVLCFLVGLQLPEYKNLCPNKMSVPPVPSSVPVVVPNALPATANYVNNNTANWALNGAVGASGVTSIVAGTNITISPTTGVGAVTVSASGAASPFVTGMIMPFNGTVAPTGWAICDGTQGTPDLRGRFILGQSASYPFGASGGATTQTLVVNNLPDHTHTGATVSTVSSNNDAGGYSYANGPNTGGISSPGYTPSVPFDILNPHYNLTFIMFL